VVYDPVRGQTGEGDDLNMPEDELRSHGFQQWLVNQNERKDLVGALSRFGVESFLTWDTADELCQLMSDVLDQAQEQFRATPYEKIPASWKPVDLTQVLPTGDRS
jgi:hypothetical protein